MCELGCKIDKISCKISLDVDGGAKRSNKRSNNISTSNLKIGVRWNFIIFQHTITRITTIFAYRKNIRHCVILVRHS